MHGPLLAPLIVAASLVAVVDFAAAAVGTASRPIADARRALADRHPAVAIGLLESALASPDLTDSADKATVLGLLRQAYEGAAAQAEAAGRPVDAESLRENARILRRKAPAAAPAPRPAAATVPDPQASPTTAPTPDPVAAMPPASGEAAADPPPALPDLAAPVAPAANRGEPADPAAASPPPDAPTPEPAAPAAAPAEPTGPGLDEADAAFRGKRYAEAGRIYADLARAGGLPAERREHWAYCRSSEVARRIDAKPKTEAEWASIDAEIAAIRVLAPTNWLGDYLRNRAAARPSGRKATKAGSTVVRAASPEEPAPAPSKPARSALAASVGPTPAGSTPVAGAVLPVTRPGSPVSRWRIRESTNFRIYHDDPKLAEQVVQVAEAVRRDQTKRWSGSLPAGPWQPRCDIYLYPNADQYAQMTGQPADSPGFSTMGMNEGQIISRRVNLRTDHAGLLAAVLPHEVTHVILADFFTEQQIPRWADEGMAVLTEPAAEQARRAADLVDPLGRNLLFPIETLMKMDYPDNQYWNLYYAQSVSLTRFLVEQGTPAQLVQFLQGAQARGFEAELKRVYKIDGFADLQARWVVYARGNLESPTATAANSRRGEARSR